MSDKIFSLSGIQWDYSKFENFWIGGKLSASNISTGFHGILKQWWDCYSPSGINDVLLVTENEFVKKELSELYKNWHALTLDLYTEIRGTNPDIIANVCSHNLDISHQFDLIINQSVLEHTYDPFTAMKNLCEWLKPGGVIISHTCAQHYEYHAFPRDYIRFMIDWWYDLPQHIDNIKLIELYEDDELHHVFSCYQKINNS